MFLAKEKLQHLNSIAHEGKIVVFATDGDGTIWYTIKQDGFEDAYLNTPADERTGWESWQRLEFPHEDDDPSVIAKQRAELTDENDTSRYITIPSPSKSSMTSTSRLKAFAGSRARP